MSARKKRCRKTSDFKAMPGSGKKIKYVLGVSYGSVPQGWMGKRCFTECKEEESLAF